MIAVDANIKGRKKRSAGKWVSSLKLAAQKGMPAKTNTSDPPNNRETKYSRSKRAGEFFKNLNIPTKDKENVSRKTARKTSVANEWMSID